MTSALRLAASQRELKEFDSVKESISDIINQLQDIDPARLSFSPFLDLDTQISLAPVSDSPESSVEELHSLSRSPPGSRQSLEPLPGGDGDTNLATLNRGHPSESFRQRQWPPQRDSQEDVVVITVPREIPLPCTIEGDSPGNRTTTSFLASPGDIPNGTDPERWNPLESTNQESTIDEDRPLLRQPLEAIELSVWDSQGRSESGIATEAADKGRCCRCRCCLGGRVPAVCSVLASLLVLPGILYGLYFHLPLDPPHCPDLASRMVLTARCCVVAAVPLLLAVLTDAASRFCAASLDPVGACPRGPALQRRFVTASIELLALYALNLVVLATFLPQEQLRAVPVLAGVFGAGRMAYWLCLHACSSWRGFGGGLTVFPLLAMVAFNLFCVFDLGLGHLFPSGETPDPPQTTPSP
ncbi:transmembrane protein 79-like [Amia ocellicauda]|uniref:transmembrane protein 79-like n=1 Tax=Amia ocellicauda TaxID=2972642 RepID=UPI0034643F2C